MGGINLKTKQMRLGILLFMALLANVVVTTMAHAQSVIVTVYACRGLDPANSGTYFSPDSPLAAGLAFCNAVVPGYDSFNHLPGPQEYRCSSSTAFGRCKKGEVYCESIPPTEPLENFDYKPFDFVENATCACLGDEWSETDPGSTTIKGCLKPKDNPGKDDGCPAENGTDKPCNAATGNKYKSQTDISGNLGFTRSYNSNNLVDLGLGKGWRSAYQKRLIVSGDSLTLASGTGRGEPWTKTGGLWSGDADSDFIVTEDASGFTVTRHNGDAEQYDLSGNLLSETDTQGKTTSYAYDANNQLISVTDHFGEVLNFSYDANGHLETVTDASGDVYSYEYDANDNLVTVIYPDTTPGDAADNPRTIYHYENVDFPNHLTGITDENGDRYQSYAYDANGKAIQSEKASTSSAVGQERMQLDYQD